MSSAALTPPGSRKSVASTLCASSTPTSASASVVLPAPSMPSIVISLPRAMAFEFRRYRGLASQDMLTELQRHPHARAVLGPALATGTRASHAYLFHGP